MTTPKQTGPLVLSNPSTAAQTDYTSSNYNPVAVNNISSGTSQASGVKYSKDTTPEAWDNINQKNVDASKNANSGVNRDGFLKSSESGTTSEIVEEYTSSSNANVLFAGYNGGKDVNSQNSTENYIRQQYSQNIKAETDDNLNGFVVPWDKWGRFSNSYTNSQSIGNKMPFGAEWVGSPSLINDHALIRFDQVAGRKHHTKLLNQRGDYSFRSSLRRQVLNTSSSADDLEKSQVKLNSDNKSGTITTKALQETYHLSGNTSYKGKSGDTVTVLSDESGELYVEVLDMSKSTWTAKDPKKTYRWVDKITVYNNGTQEVVEVANKYEIAADQKTEVIIENISAEADAGLPDPSITNSPEDTSNGEKPTTVSLSADSVKKLNPGWSKDPRTTEYWLVEEFNWIKCGQQVIPDGAFCENGVAKVPGPVKGVPGNKALDNIVIKSKSDIKKAELWASRNWEKSQGSSRRVYLSKLDTGSSNDAKVIEPTTTELCNLENWKGQEQFFYKPKDFLYCTYFGWIPNNYLITLRRFPMPVPDNASIPDQDTSRKSMTPIARAVTWAGEITGNKIDEIGTFSSKLNWRELKAEVHEVMGNEQGALDGSPFAGTAKFLGMLNNLTSGGGFGAVSGWDEQRAKFDPYKDGAYYNKIYGPVNVIDKTKARDRGMEFEHSLTLNFHYNLKEIGGINEKAAMLDIIANFLALTSSNADFWGGANRYFPNKPAYPFLGDKEGMKKWYAGDVTGFMSSVGNQLQNTFKGVMDMLNEFMTNPTAALKKLAGNGAKLAVAESIRKKGSRPALLGFKALLSGAPVGEWHLMIGNPFNPFMMIGNLICTGVTFSFGNTFGIDDFPEEMIVKVTLEHGKPRDKGDIESMFNRGNGRLHFAYFGETEAWNNASSSRDSKINKWETAGTSNASKAKKHGDSDVLTTALNESKKLYNVGSKEASNLAHKVAFL